MKDKGCPNTIRFYRSWEAYNRYKLEDRDFWQVVTYVMPLNSLACGEKGCEVLQTGIFTMDSGYDPEGKVVKCKKCGFIYYLFPPLPAVRKDKLLDIPEEE